MIICFKALTCIQQEDLSPVLLKKAFKMILNHRRGISRYLKKQTSYGKFICIKKSKSADNIY